MVDWPFEPPITPMEAEVADELPRPPGWAYEPKWDGFRVVMWSAADAAETGRATDSADQPGRPGRPPRLDSRNAKPLLRYFPELEPALAQLPHGTVLDGEVVVSTNGRLDFDSLQNRIHPAESRIRLLARQTPAQLALFDLLALRGSDLRRRPFAERRRALEDLYQELDPGLGAGKAPGQPQFLLSPSTRDVIVAQRWFNEFEPAGFDGIVAKALERPYAEGRREMIKVKHRRTVDCVVGGYRLHKDGKRVGSLLLGLYNPEGELHFIGHCSSFGEAEAAMLLEALRPLAALQPAAEAEGLDAAGAAAGIRRSGGSGGSLALGFGEHARRPGILSRWSGDRELEFVPVRPELVIEVSYDQLTADRFRHATRFERWRPDKDPRDCTMDQLERPKGPALIAALRRARRSRS